MATIIERLRNAYSAFKERDPTIYDQNIGYGYVESYGLSRVANYQFCLSQRTNLSVLMNKIAVDCSLIQIRHVRLNEKGKYEETIEDELNDIFNFKANVDQSGKMFVEDIVFSMLENGHAALIPAHTDADPKDTEAYKILSARVGKVVKWFPYHVLVEGYYEELGRRKIILLEKKSTPIVQNPFYAIMNEPNSTLQRLKRVLGQLERSNDVNSNDKLDMIIQLPYTLKNPVKKELAKERREELEKQLNGSRLGIGFIDSTEQVIQLNRSLENNLYQQAKDLNRELFNQIGVSEEVFKGTADEQQMLNYQKQALQPILEAIVDAVKMTWISKTARSQRQSIMYFKSPFDLVPVDKIAEMGDKMLRNRITTSNEFRSILGLEPVKDDPMADKLDNPNLNQSKEAEAALLENKGKEIIEEKKKK